MLNKEMLELLHDRGQIPDWAYYQQNGKSLDDNYQFLLNQRQIRFQDKKEFEEKLQNELLNLLEDILDNILK